MYIGLGARDEHEADLEERSLRIGCHIFLPRDVVDFPYEWIDELPIFQREGHRPAGSLAAVGYAATRLARPPA